MPAQQAVFEARQRYRQRDDLLLLAATYWLLGGKPDQVDPSFVQNQMGHACEWETSMILHLAPEPGRRLERRSSRSRRRCRSSRPRRAGSRRERSAPGHIGDPRRATAEKGQTLFRIFSHDVVTFLERVIAWDGRSWDG